jgi:bacterial translation initiation factor 2 (bIF-2)
LKSNPFSGPIQCGLCAFVGGIFNSSIIYKLKLSMSIRLNKVARDLNVGIQTAVEFLQKKGFTVEANPNTKITDEQYALLVKEFSKDKKFETRIGEH